MGSASARVAGLWIVARSWLPGHDCVGMGAVCSGGVGNTAGRRVDSRCDRRQMGQTEGFLPRPGDWNWLFDCLKYPCGRAASNLASRAKCKHRQTASAERDRDHSVDILVTLGGNLRGIYYSRISAKTIERLAEERDSGSGNPGNYLWRSSRVSGAEVDGHYRRAGQPDGMAGAMAQEPETRDALTFHPGRRWRDCSGKALSQTEIKKSGEMRDAALF